MIDYLHVASWASWLPHCMSLTQIPPPYRMFFFDIVRIYVILCYIIVLGFFLLFFSSSLLFYFVFEIKKSIDRGRYLGRCCSN